MTHGPCHPSHNRPMPAPPLHVCRDVRALGPGVHLTDLESARHFGRHSHDTYGFGLVVAGAQQSASGRGAVEAFAGDLIATNPGEIHDGRPYGAASRRWRMVYLSADAMADAAGARELAIVRPVMHDARLASALATLFTRVFDGDDALGCEEAFVTACARLLDGHTTAAAPREVDASVVAARDRLAAGDLPPASLQDLATLAGLSRYQVLRRFEKAYGLPPHAWRLQHRTEQARGLIARGLTLADAAAAAGFADQSHLTRAFVRQFGFTPGAWRAAAA